MMDEEKREWRQTSGGTQPGLIGMVPLICDGCGHPLSQTAYDCKTQYGPWSWLCQACFAEVGTGLGVGRGQKYQSFPAKPEKPAGSSVVYDVKPLKW
jgi:hypothetical protein